MKFKKTEVGIVPEEWDVKTVKELIEENVIFKPLDGNHGNIHPKSSDYVPRGVPFIMANDLIDGTVDCKKCKFITEKQASSLKKGFSIEGDVLLTHKATIGRTAIVRKPPSKYIVLTPQVTYYRIAKNDVLVNEYLKYYFDSKGFQELLNSWSQGGSTRAYLGITAQQKLPIVIPPLVDQKFIAHILSTLDEKIEVNNQINKKLEEMAQTIFKHWFVDYEFPNEDGEPYKSSGGEMVDSELGMIPKGWNVGKLEDIAIITMGQSPKGSSYNEDGEGAVFYQGRTDFTNRFPVRRLYTTEPKRMAKSGDILMSVRAPVGDINIANEECCIGRGLCSLKSKDNMNSFLLYLLLNLKEKFNVFNGEGTVFGSITQRDLKGMKITMPNDFCIKKFNEITTILDKQYWCLDKQSKQLTHLRDTLLPKLMSGEIRVPLDSEVDVL